MRCGIDSISLNPDTVLKTTQEIVEVERALADNRAPEVNVGQPALASGN